MFKFQVGEVVKKSKGYTFVGVVRARYEVAGGRRYDLQVDKEIFADEIRTMISTGAVVIKHSSNEIEEALIEYTSNCDGMIHIFAEEQLEHY